MSFLLSSAHPFPPISQPTFPSPLPLQLRFSALTCLAHLFFFTLQPHTSQSTSIWLYTFFFSLIIIYNHGPIFCMILLPRLLHSLGVIPCPLFPISKASFTSSTISPKHFKSLMPSAFATLFFFNFVYHNITTCNAMLSSLQMSSYLLIEPFLSVFGVPLKNITVR